MPRAAAARGCEQAQAPDEPRSAHDVVHSRLLARPVSRREDDRTGDQFVSVRRRSDDVPGEPHRGRPVPHVDAGPFYDVARLADRRSGARPSLAHVGQRVRAYPPMPVGDQVMSDLFGRWARLVTARPRATLFFCILATATLGFAARHVRLDNNFSALFASPGPEADLRKEYRERFGPDDGLPLAIIHPQDPNDPKVIDAVEAASDEVAKDPAIAHVYSV